MATRERGLTVSRFRSGNVARPELWAAAAASHRAWIGVRPADAAGLFHPDVVAVVPGQERRVEGRDAIVRTYVESFATVRTHGFQAMVHSVNVLGDVAVVCYRLSVRCEMCCRIHDEIGHGILVYSRMSGRWGVARRTQIPSARQGLEPSRTAEGHLPMARRIPGC